MSPTEAATACGRASSEVSLLHRRRGGEWHCALCDSTRCPHVEVAEQAARERALSRQAVG